MSNSLDPDQARRFMGPDLGTNCLPIKVIRRRQVKINLKKIHPADVHELWHITFFNV